MKIFVIGLTVVAVVGLGGLSVAVRWLAADVAIDYSNGSPEERVVVRFGSREIGPIDVKRGERTIVPLPLFTSERQLEVRIDGESALAACGDATYADRYLVQLDGPDGPTCQMDT